MKTTLFLLAAAAIASAKAMALPSIPTLFAAPGAGPPVSAACKATYEKFDANAAYAAADKKRQADIHAVGMEIGGQCGQHLSPCTTNGASQCCTEDAIADGDWTPYEPDGYDLLAAAQAIDAKAQLCFINVEVTSEVSATQIIDLTFNNYVPLIIASSCSDADKAALLKFFGQQCMAGDNRTKACSATSDWGNQCNELPPPPRVDRCAAAIEAACPQAHRNATAADQCIECAWKHHEALEAEAACGGHEQLKGHVQRACGATDDDLMRVGKRLSPFTSCQSLKHCDDCFTHTVAFVHTCFWGTGAGCIGAGGIQCQS